MSGKRGKRQRAERKKIEASIPLAPKKILPKKTIQPVKGVVNSKEWKNIFLGFIKRAWGWVLTFFSVTGLTIFSFLPKIGFTLKSTTDQNWLLVEITNNSLVTLKNIDPGLFVYSMHTTLGDSVRIRLKATVSNNPIPTELKGNQKHTVDYSMNENFFHYRNRPEYIGPAFMALDVEYTWLGLSQEQTFFVECRPDYHGNYTWLETQDQDWFEVMKADTVVSLEDIPYLRQLRSDPRFKNVPVVPIPPLPKD